MVVVGAGMTGCGDDAEPTSSESSASVWPQPTADSMTIDPVDEIDGAELFESDGVSVLVPDGWETRRTETADYVMIHVLQPDDERNPVAVMIETQEGSADAVEATASVTFAQLGASGATDLLQRPVTWAGWPYASGVTGIFDQGSDGEVVDFVQVVALSGSGMVVGVSAQAPRGELDDSLAYEILRSVRPVD